MFRNKVDGGSDASDDDGPIAEIPAVTVASGITPDADAVSQQLRSRLRTRSLKDLKEDCSRAGMCGYSEKGKEELIDLLVCEAMAKGRALLLEPETFVQQPAFENDGDAQAPKRRRLTDGTSEAVPMELREASDVENRRAHLSGDDALASIPSVEDELQTLREQRQTLLHVDQQLQKELQRMVDASEGDFTTLGSRAAEVEQAVQDTEEMIKECVARLKLALATGIASKEIEKDSLKVRMKEDLNRMTNAKTSEKAAHCEKLNTRIKAIESVLATLKPKLEAIGAVPGSPMVVIV